MGIDQIAENQKGYKENQPKETERERKRTHSVNRGGCNISGDQVHSCGGGGGGGGARRGPCWKLRGRESGFLSSKLSSVFVIIKRLYHISTNCTKPLHPL